MGKKIETASILRQEEIAEGIFSMWMQTDAASEAKAGQFVSLYSRDTSHLLPRPISICEMDEKASAIRIVYRVVGWGTEEFSHLISGDTVRMMAPLGNGFPLEGNHPVVIGGGIGVPPMVELAKRLSSDVTAVMGYRDQNLFLKDEFEQNTSRLVIATDDGSVGVHGTVIDAIAEQKITGDVMYACGPKPMLAAVKAYAIDHHIRCYVSMEERMACGIGACLGCVCETKEIDAHSNVKNKRICKDGPVFLAEEVQL